MPPTRCKARSTALRRSLTHATVAGLTAQESAADQTVAAINQEMVGYKKQLAD